MRKYALFALLMILVICLLCIPPKRKKNAVETLDKNVTTENEIKDELISTLFIEIITNDIINFYSEYYAGEIAIYDYETVILEIQKADNGRIEIKFGVTPQIGAHNPLGYDELLYSVDSTGNSRLNKYWHIESYPVPEKFEEYVIKPIE